MRRRLIGSKARKLKAGREWPRQSVGATLGAGQTNRQISRQNKQSRGLFFCGDSSPLAAAGRVPGRQGLAPAVGKSDSFPPGFVLMCRFRSAYAPAFAANCL